MSNENQIIGSQINGYFKDKSIFITGATGFIGKVLLEKLLRSCYDLKAIYVLVRSKKGRSPRQRLNELLHCKLFDNLSQFYPEFRQKLVPINGDLLEPNLGISKEDEDKLLKNVNIVMHSAATVRFDEPLKLAVEMNIIGVKKMIDLARKMENLEVFVHVSTAYANCDRQHISEIVYNPPIQPDKILEAVDWMEEDLIGLLTTQIIQFRPNTYTYTKAIAENLIVEAEKYIPCVIVRPSIVGATWREPFQGWIDNFNGPTALFIALGKGMLRVMRGNKNAIADMVPVDTVVNLMIASAWLRGSKRSKECLVYNCTSGQIKPLKWSLFEKRIVHFTNINPFENVFLIPYATYTTSIFVRDFKIFLLQMVPAFIMDLYLKIIHKKPIYVRIQHKLKKTFDSLEYFTTHEWEFTNDNVFMLMNQLNEFDSQSFNFDVREMQWETYFENYIIGAKTYLLKEDPKNMDKCRKSLERVRFIFKIIKATGFVILIRYLFLRQYSFKDGFAFIFRLALYVANYVFSHLSIFRLK